MVDIISKKSGPRREDVVAKRTINQNWPTIARLADQISNGGYSRSRKAIAKAKETPEPDNLSIHLLGDRTRTVQPEPIVRISINNRVIVIDARSGKQLEYLGEMRFQGNQKYFALATEENGFYATVDEETKHLLSDLNGVIMETDNIQDAFIGVIKDRLGL